MLAKLLGEEFVNKLSQILIADIQWGFVTTITDDDGFLIFWAGDAKINVAKWCF